MQDNPPVFTNGKVATVPTDVTTELPTMVSSTSTDIADPALQLSSKKIKNQRDKANNPSNFPLFIIPGDRSPAS
jgi:hypothetical protein